MTKTQIINDLEKAYHSGKSFIIHEVNHKDKTEQLYMIDPCYVYSFILDMKLNGVYIKTGKTKDESNCWEDAIKNVGEIKYHEFHTKNDNAVFNVATVDLANTKSTQSDDSIVKELQEMYDSFKTNMIQYLEVDIDNVNNGRDDIYDQIYFDGLLNKKQKKYLLDKLKNYRYIGSDSNHIYYSWIASVRNYKYQKYYIFQSPTSTKRLEICVLRDPKDNMTEEEVDEAINNGYLDREYEKLNSFWIKL
jgi:hypothetical protein